MTEPALPDLTDDSILRSVKKMLGLDPDYHNFDVDVTLHINSVLMVLTQLGIGPPEGFSVTSEDSTWHEFVGNRPNVEAIKSYVYLKVRLMFDPPANSFVVNSFEKQAEELAWRLNIQGERIII